MWQLYDNWRYGFSLSLTGGLGTGRPLPSGRLVGLGGCRHGTRQSAARCTGRARSGGGCRRRSGIATGIRTSGCDCSPDRVGPGLSTSITAWPASVASRSVMRGLLGAEVHGIIDELVEHLDDEVRRAGEHDRLGGQFGAELPLRKAGAIGARGAVHEGAQVEAGPLGALNGLFDPGGGAHGHQDRVQPLAALAGPVQVGAGGRR